MNGTAHAHRNARPAADEFAGGIPALAGDAPVALGLVLGSGLGHLAEAVDGPAIAYADLQRVPQASVSGHAPTLVVGTRVALFGAREHYYERGRPDAIRLPLETRRAPGAGRLLLTNAAGSLRADIPPGELMLWPTTSISPGSTR